MTDTSNARGGDLKTEGLKPEDLNILAVRRPEKAVRRETCRQPSNCH